MKKSLFDWCKENNKDHLIDEWVTERNRNELGLEMVNVKRGSTKKVWWRCSVDGYEWKARIDHRTISGSGCPVCSGNEVLSGYNDLATTHPELAKEWHPTKNGDIKPTDVIAGSRRKFWWYCSKGHEWEAISSNRVRGNNCPYCSNQKLLLGYNDMATTHPKLAKEWHPTKNGDIKPTDVIAGSRRKFWWYCSKGHEWEAISSNRVNGNNCPYCSNKGTSFPEQYLYHALKIKFRSVSNRTKINNYEYDIYIKDVNLLIEYDGIYWHRVFSDKSEREKKKTMVAKNNGFDFIRIAERKDERSPEMKKRAITISNRVKVEDLNAVIMLIVRYVNNTYDMDISDEIPDHIETRVRELIKSNAA